MKFGTRAAEAPERGGGETWIKYCKKGETRLRFLEECDDWIEYFEHYNPNPGEFPFPCTGDKKTCPGCTSDLEKMRGVSRRYLVNCLFKGYVEPFKITAKLRDRLVTRSERNGGTITDRDYTIINSGDGEYDYDQEERAKLDLSMYKPQFHDHETLLHNAFKEAWPDIDIGEPPAPEPSQQEPPPSKPAESKPEPQQEKDAGDSGDSEITVDQLKQMRLGQIYTLLDKEGVTDYPEEMTKPELIDWIVEKFSA